MIDFLAQAKEHLKATFDLPFPDGLALSDHWQRKQKELYDYALSVTDPLEAIRWAQIHEHSTFNHRRECSEESVTRQIRALEKRHDFCWATSPYSESDISARDLVTVDGKLASNILCWHLEMLLTARRYNRLYQVAEIGSGLGELARLAEFHNNKNMIYVLIDLPASLFFARLFLELASQENNSGCGLHRLLPVQMVEQEMGPFDCVISQGSMQEMSPEFVAYWCKFIDRMTTCFISLNYPEMPIALPPAWECVHRERSDGNAELKLILDAVRIFEERVYVKR